VVKTPRSPALLLGYARALAAGAVNSTRSALPCHNPGLAVS
jgi:hypothetical protein